MNSIIKISTAWVLAIAAAVSMQAPVSAASVTQLEEKAEIIKNVPKLVPASPESAELDKYLNELMATLIDDEMDTYEQVKACYDYVKNNTRYGSHLAKLDTRINGTTCRKISREYGPVEGFGAVALSAGTGLCNAYASAFILLARKIGLSAYLVKGRTRKAGGGYTYHEWCEIKIGDSAYVFDPQLDQSLTRAGLGEYMVFCAVYSEIPGRYVKY